MHFYYFRRLTWIPPLPSRFPISSRPRRSLSCCHRRIEKFRPVFTRGWERSPRCFCILPRGLSYRPRPPPGGSSERRESDLQTIYIFIYFEVLLPLAWNVAARIKGLRFRLFCVTLSTSICPLPPPFFSFKFNIARASFWFYLLLCFQRHPHWYRIHDNESLQLVFGHVVYFDMPRTDSPRLRFRQNFLSLNSEIQNTV